ncbi:calmodulin-binding protein 60 F-like [Rhododendron vialii]|uniref:calmodulin-binding protein 60 F-like n=1 Tax=Rhododendron vialii TaxID=182163 RepID=UPI00265E6C06|nr:calmodulin-binding protein 60 F-like [Rhododendron vialii]
MNNNRKCTSAPGITPESSGMVPSAQECYQHLLQMWLTTSMRNWYEPLISLRQEKPEGLDKLLNQSLSSPTLVASIFLCRCHILKCHKNVTKYNCTKILEDKVLFSELIYVGHWLVILKEGVGTLGDMTFTDNSSWTRSRKFRLGLKVATRDFKEVRVREAKTEAFAVKDHRGECDVQKHYPPALRDEVWRSDRIAKDGALHKKLIKADIITVENFLRVLVRDPQRLRSILGSGMSNRMWDNTVEHAKMCVLGEKLYVYYSDGTNSMGAVFNDIYELRGLIANGQFFPLDSLTHNQNVSVDSLVKTAYENWNQVIEYDGKVLNSLSIRNHGTRASFETTSDQNPVTKQQHISSESIPQCQMKNHLPSNSQLSEFPFMRSDSMAGMASLDYGLVGMSEFGGSFFPGEWSRPRDCCSLLSLNLSSCEEVRWHHCFKVSLQVFSFWA